MKNGIILSAIVFTLSLTACSNYLEEFEDEYRDSAYAKTDIFSPTESSASIIDASSSDARAEGQSSGKTDEEFDCDMNDSACISEIANEFGKTVRLFDSRNNNVYTAIYVGGLDYETANGYGSIFDDSVSFLLMTENLEYEGESVTALDTNGVFFYTYENAEKACPTGWRLPKITPEWSFLLTGNGSRFNIELPDNEKGCYTDGKFDSGKSIFYWAQKEGETSWFVQKNYLANDYDSHERCNTFPVRCAKEFGHHADYAGSSSSSGETKSSSSVKSSSSSAKSSSSSVASSSSEVCSEYTIAPVTAITFVYDNLETSRDLNANFFNSEDSIISTVKKRVVNSFSACKLSSENIQVKSSDNGEFNDNDTFKSICYDSSTVKVLVSNEDFSCIKCAADVFNSECPVAAAAKFLGSSSSSISGTLLFEAKDSGKMKNGEEINTRSSTGDLDPSFADGWMKVSGYSRPDAPQVAFFADPGLETEAPDLPVDIRSWGGVCVTYSSNVDFMLVARYNWDGKIKNVEIGKIERTTSAYPVTQKCLEWGEKKNSLTAIDQISLIHIQEGDDPEIATIYIKNISTVKKNEVVINVEGTADVYGDLFYKLEDETIDLTLFGSFTVPKDVRNNNIYLMVTADGKDYYSRTAYNSGVVLLDEVCGPVEDTSPCQTFDQDFSTLQNPVLYLIGLQNLGQFNKGDEIKYTVTFHPKSWYAAPVPSSTSN